MRALQEHLVQSSAFPKRLQKWLDYQRYLYRSRVNGASNQLTDEHVKQLEALPISMTPREDHWEERYQQLCGFYERQKCLPYDCDLEVLSDDDQKLLWWCRKQKSQFKVYRHDPSQTTLTEERIAKLEQIGFVWDAYETAWMNRYQELVDYARHHGDCNVPAEYPPNQALAKWVSDQRVHYKRQTDGEWSSMSPERKKLLNEVGFVWNTNDARWMDKYSELREHMRVHGMGSIPLHRHNKSLRRWVDKQRELYRIKRDGGSCSLTDERERLLKAVGVL